MKTIKTFYQCMLLSMVLFTNISALEVLLKHESISDNSFSKPRICIKNNGVAAINGFQFYYYFTIEDNKIPVIERWYIPNSTVTLENRGNGNFRIKYLCSGVTLAPGEVYPDLSGNSVGVHYSDYSVLLKANDYSYNGSEIFVGTNKIPVYDMSGNLLTGIDPEIPLPVVPTLANPVNGAIDIPINSTLSWNPATGADSYTVQVSMSSTFSDLIIEQAGITSTSFTVTGLAYSTQIYWHVKSTNAAGTSGWSETRSFITEASPSVPPVLPPGQWEYSIISTESTVLKDRFQLTGNGCIASKQYIEIGQNAVLGTDLLSGNNILVMNRAFINGNVTSAGNTQLQDAVRISGTITMNDSNVSIPDIPQKATTYGNEDITVEDSNIKELDPGYYRDLNVFSYAKLILRAGVYSFRSVNFEPDAEIHIDAMQGTGVNIDVQNKIRFADRVKIIKPEEYFAPNIQFYSNFNDTITIGTNCQIMGIISAPFAMIHIGASTAFSGAVYGKRVQFDCDAHINGNPYSVLFDRDNDMISDLLEEILETDPDNPASFPYHAVSNIQILPETMTRTVTYDFSKYYSDYSECSAAPVTLSGSTLVNGIAPIITALNKPIYPSITRPGNNSLRMVGRYIEYYGNIVAGQNVTVFVPFPDELVTVPEAVKIGHYVNGAWDILEPDSVNNYGAYCTVNSFSPFALLVQSVQTDAYAEGSVYTATNSAANLQLSLKVALVMDEVAGGAGKITISYNDRNGDAQSTEADFSYNDNYWYNRTSSPVSCYYTKLDITELGPVHITGISINIPGTATEYSEACFYTVLPGDRGNSFCIITPQELNNAAVKGDKIPFCYGVSSLLMQYNLITGATGIEGQIIPEYNNYGHVTGNTYKYYVKDHLGSTRAVIDDQALLNEATEYTPYGMINTLHNGSDVKNKFTGKEFDREGSGVGINAYYFGARFYDPELGIWLSTDPQNQFFTPYGYPTNPVIMIDPDGNLAWYIPMLIGAAMGGTAGGIASSAAGEDWWKGAIVGGLIGAWGGTLASPALGATGIVSSSGAVTTGWGITTSSLNGAVLNMAMSIPNHQGLDGVWKSGVVGAASGAFTASGGLGLAKAGFIGRQLFQSIGSGLRSVGNNWAEGKKPFSKVTVGVGPINLTLGKGQFPIQLQNNIGNIVTNTLGLTNLLTGGSINFNWEHLTFNYSGGALGKAYNFFGTQATGIFSILGDAPVGSLTEGHELHHIWQSRSMGDAFFGNYLMQLLNAATMARFHDSNYTFGTNLFLGLNSYEAQAYGGEWGY